MFAVIRQFHDVMQACVRLDDGECSHKFDVGQGLREGRVLAPLLFNMLFTAVLRVAEKRVLADAAITDNMVQLQRKKEKGEKKGTSRSGRVDGRRGAEEEEVQRLLGMLYTDDRHNIAIIRRAGDDDDGDRDCVLGVRVYGLRSENRDCVPANHRGGGVVHNQCSRPGIKQTIVFVCLGGAITADRDVTFQMTQRLQMAWASFQWYKIGTYDRPGVRLQLKVRLLKAEVVETLRYGCTTWSPNKPDNDRLRRVHYSMLLRCLGWSKRKRDDHTLSHADALAKTTSKSIEAIVPKQRILFAGFVARMGEERLPQRVMFRELVGGKGYAGGQEKD